MNSGPGSHSAILLSFYNFLGWQSTFAIPGKDFVGINFCLWIYFH